MQYSPKLKNIMEQIKKILKDNDVAAFVVIHENGFSEFINHVETSLSAVKISDTGLHVKLKKNDPNADKIAQNTLNMCHHLAKSMGENALMFMNMEDLLIKKWGEYHLPGTFTSNTQQNN